MWVVLLEGGRLSFSGGCGWLLSGGVVVGVPVPRRRLVLLSRRRLFPPLPRCGVGPVVAAPRCRSCRRRTAGWSRRRTTGCSPLCRAAVSALSLPRRRLVRPGPVPRAGPVAPVLSRRRGAGSPIAAAPLIGLAVAHRWLVVSLLPGGWCCRCCAAGWSRGRRATGWVPCCRTTSPIPLLPCRPFVPSAPRAAPTVATQRPPRAPPHRGPNPSLPRTRRGRVLARCLPRLQSPRDFRAVVVSGRFRRASAAPGGNRARRDRR